MSDSRWRKIATPIIAAVIEDMRGENEKSVRKALRDAYPFGPKKYHPYKIWCDEVSVQLGTKQEKVKEAKLIEHDPNQTVLF